MSDLAATNCGCGEERTGCGCDNNCGCNNGCGNGGMGNWGGNCCNIIWIIILLCFCGGNNWGNNCGCNHGNGDCCWIIIILLLLCGCGNGFGC